MKYSFLVKSPTPAEVADQLLAQMCFYRYLIMILECLVQKFSWGRGTNSQIIYFKGVKCATMWVFLYPRGEEIETEQVCVCNSSNITARPLFGKADLSEPGDMQIPSHLLCSSSQMKSRWPAVWLQTTLRESALKRYQLLALKGVAPLR